MVVNGETIPSVVLPPRPPCNYDWTKCKNANDLLKNDDGYRNILPGCNGSAWMALYLASERDQFEFNNPSNNPYREKFMEGRGAMTNMTADMQEAMQFTSPFKWDGVDYHDGVIMLVASDRDMGVNMTCTYNLRTTRVQSGYHLNVPGDTYSARDCRSSTIGIYQWLQKQNAYEPLDPATRKHGENCGIIITTMRR
jgi:hypothetical protein